MAARKAPRKAKPVDLAALQLRPEVLDLMKVMQDNPKAAAEVDAAIKLQQLPPKPKRARPAR